MMHLSFAYSLVEIFEELASTLALTAESGTVTILNVTGDTAAVIIEQVKFLF